MPRTCWCAVVAFGLLTLAPVGIPTAAAQRPSPIVVDHRSTSLSAIPVGWIAQAKADLHIGYGHTSHGSQITDGMTGLAAWKGDLYAWNDGGVGGALDLHDGDGYGSGDLDHDAGYYPNWVDETRSYLGTPDPQTGRGINHPDTNVIIWSWCGQVSSQTEQTMLDTYLTPMSQLEPEYPGVTFVYMTGHLDGSGATGNLNLRNQQIRDYVAAHNKVLYDFADIESYDPDGLVHYMPLMADDGCNYDSDGDGSRESNWCSAWQDTHILGVDWYNCGAAHTLPLNANRKAYAAWWLWARLAGWSGTERTLTIDDVTVDEGAPYARFTVTLSEASTEPVTVAFTTATGTATSEDFTAASDRLTFAPGETSKTIDVTVIDDSIDEANEVFYVALSDANGADILDAQGIGTIVDNDEPAALLAIGDAVVAEGNCGTRNATFTVTLSPASAMTVTVRYATGGGTATAGEDYTAVGTPVLGTLTFDPGVVSQTVTVPVLGDTAFESDETFTVTLSEPVNAALADSEGVGTITNDDRELSPGEKLVSWMRLAGVSACGADLAKTSPLGWNAGASSTRGIVSGEGYAEFAATASNVFWMAGLSHGDTDVSYGDIDFAVYAYGTGYGYAFESGVKVASLGTYQAGDVFRVEYQGGALRYRKNGVVKYEHPATVTYPLLLDTSLYTPGAVISTAVLAGTLAESVVWTNLVGTTASGNSLTKPAGGAVGWNAGASSTKGIASGDGYAEFAATANNVFWMAGLSHGDSDTSYAEIDFAVYAYGSGNAYAFESGVKVASLGAYQAGDVFRVEYQGGAIQYKKNGVVKYEHLATVTYPLLLDASLYSPGAVISNAVLAGTLSAPPEFPAPEAVVWTSLVGTTAAGSTLTKSVGGAAGWNAGAVSEKGIASGDGYAEFTATANDVFWMAGLSHGNTDVSYADIDFSIYVYGTGYAYAFEGGVNRASLGPYQAGDVFRVEYQGGMVRYRKNGVVKYEHTATVTYPLLLDTSLYTPEAQISNAVLAGTLQ